MSVLSNSPNFFLSSLSPEDANLLQPHIKLIELPASSVLYKAEETIERVYFPYSGIVSFVIGVSSGQFVEAGVIGRNSAVGIGAALDGAIAINEAIVQVAISGVAINTSTLRQLAAESEALRISCARHEEMTLGQVQQVAACNAVHNCNNGSPDGYCRHMIFSVATKCHSLKSICRKCWVQIAAA
jgi:CRP-like cAMP-binding protein